MLNNIRKHDKKNIYYMFVLIFIFIHTDLLPNVLQILSLRKIIHFKRKKNPLEITEQQRNKSVGDQKTPTLSFESRIYGGEF